jgi:hypothetical protein
LLDIPTILVAVGAILFLASVAPITGGIVVRFGNDSASLRIPLTYNGAADEVVINFNKIGESSELVIKSIHVSG